MSVIEQLVTSPNFGLLVPEYFLGVTNHCFEEGYFHVFIDCDDATYEDVLKSCESIKHLTGSLYILQTSSWKWSVVSFSKHSWAEYMSIMGSFIARDLSYEWCCWNKNFSVLRCGPKRGNDRIRKMFMVRGRLKECLDCKKVFFDLLNYYEKGVV